MKRHPVAVRLRLIKRGWIEKPFPSEERKLVEPKAVTDTTSTAGARLQSLLAARSDGDCWRLWHE
jgi:hypothetical protein